MEDILTLDSSNDEMSNEEDIYDWRKPLNKCTCHEINNIREKEWIESTTFEERFHALNHTSINKNIFSTNLTKIPPKCVSCHLCKNAPPSSA